MRVLWHWPHPHRVLHPIAEALLRAGDSLVVQCLEVRAGDRSQDDPRVQFRRELPRVRELAGVPAGLRRVLRSEAYVRRSALRHRLVRTGGFDVVHVQMPNLVTDPWTLGRLRRRTAVVLSVHDVMPHERRLPGRLERALLGRLYRSADVLVVFHPIVAERLGAEFGVPEDSVVVTRLAVVPADVPSPALRRGGSGEVGPIRFLFFGTFRNDKGLPDLVAAARLLAGDPHVHIHVAGRGEPHLERIVAEHAARGVLTAEIEHVSERRKAELFGAADVVVLPYGDPERFQSQSAVLADAYAFGRPVVVTDVGALGPTVRADRSGWVVPAGDPGALAAVLRSVALDLPGRRAAAQAIAGRLPDYSPYAVGSAFRAAYVEAVARRRARHLRCGSGT